MTVIQLRGASAVRRASASFRPGSHAETAFPKMGAIRIGASPIRKQQTTRTLIGPIMETGDSCARRAWSDRAVPRKTAPYTFTKHAKAKAPIRDSAGAAKAAAANDDPSPAPTVPNRPRELDRK